MTMPPAAAREHAPDDAAALSDDGHTFERGRRVTPWLGMLVALVPLIWSLDLTRSAGFVFYDEQFLAIILGLALAMTFIAFPAWPAATTRVPWYDWIAAAAGFAACAYVAARFATISLNVAMRPTDALVCAAIILGLSLEALRRSVGVPLMIVALVFVAYGLVGHLAPDAVAGRQIAPERLLLYIAYDLNGILGLPLNVIASVLVAFMFLGAALTETGGSTFFTDLSVALMGRFRGGAAKISVIASALFGSISGSPVSNVVSTGVVTIPLMRQSGYRREKAAAIEAVASTGGQLMPPVMGAGAFLMAEFLRVPYFSIVVAALVPAFLYYAALFLVVDLEAAKLKIHSVRAPDLPPSLRILAGGWSFIVAFTIVIVCMFSLNMQPGMSATLGTVALIAMNVVFGYKGRRLTATGIGRILSNTGHSVLGIIMIGAVASYVIAVLNVTGLGFALTLLLINLGGGNALVLLAVSAVIAVILGMGMPTVAVYALLGVLIAPSLVESGLEPIAAHMFVFYFGILSGVTPPVAVAAFAAAHVARGSGFRTCFEAMRLGWSAYLVPFLFALSPTLLLIGDPVSIAVDVATAILGVGLTTAGVAGYLFAPAGPLTRVLMVSGGVAVMVPAGAFAGAAITDIAGFVAGCVAVGLNLLERRRSVGGGETRDGRAVGAEAEGSQP